MKRLFPIIVCVIFGCQGDIVEQNPYLNNLPSFEFELNLDLPLYDNLRFAGGTLTLSQLGLKGVHLYNLMAPKSWHGKQAAPTKDLVTAPKPL